MNDTLLAPTKLQPVCLSLPQLTAALLPITAGYKWGEGTIRDLWMLGAPMPPMSGAVVAGDVRLIVPSQLMKWLEDVLTRQGKPLSDSARLYAQMVKDGS